MATPIQTKPPAAPIAGVEVDSSTHSYVGEDAGGTLVNFLNRQKSRPARKDNSDVIGNKSGAFTIDFGAGNFDHKTQVTLTAASTITLDPGTQARQTDHLLHVKSSAAASRAITWAFGGGSALAARHYLPTLVDDTAGWLLSLRYFDGLWYPTPVVPKVKSVTGSVVATYTPDCANGVYLDFVVTGVFGDAGTKTELQLPSNLPDGQQAFITFLSPQSVGFNVNSAYKTLGQRPNYDAVTQLGIYRVSSTYYIRGLDVETWVAF